MLALIQRVQHANVVVDGDTVSKIGHGMLVLLGIEKNDTEQQADRLSHKMLHYRLFSDSDEKLNLNVQQVNGSVLVVSQITLAANTNKGLRPSLSSAANPERGKALYEYFVTKSHEQYPQVATGIFQANMQVNLCNDGPVTFLLDCKP